MKRTLLLPLGMVARRRARALASGGDGHDQTRARAALGALRSGSRWVRRGALGDPAVPVTEAAVPAALEATARALRAGASLRDSLADAAQSVPEPLRGELSSIADDARRGASLVGELERWAIVRPQPGVRLAAAALALVAETGGSPARTLDGVAATLRERAALEREVRALATQARASAAVVACAPVAFVLLMATVDPATLGFLLRTPTGLLCLVVGVALDTAGALWMRQITRSVR